MISSRRPAAGSLRHKLKLYDVPTTTLDEYGQPDPTVSATLIGIFVGRKQSLKGQILASTRANWPTATHKITLPWLGSAIPATASNPARKILPGMYVVMDEDGTRLDIVFADNVDDMNHVWELTCQEKVLV